LNFAEKKDLPQVEIHGLALRQLQKPQHLIVIAQHLPFAWAPLFLVKAGAVLWS